MKAYNIAKAIAYILVILFGLWFTISFIDIVAHNMTTHQYLSWNFFEVMLKVTNN